MEHIHYFSVGEDGKGRGYFSREGEDKFVAFHSRAEDQGFRTVGTFKIRDGRFGMAVHFCESYKSGRMTDDELTRAMRKLEE